MSGEPNPPLLASALRPLRWLIDAGRARRLRRLRRAPVRMIDRSVLLRLGTGGLR